MEPLTHGELFAGIGGFGLGFDSAGMKTLWHVENNSACQFVLKRRFPNALLLSDVKNCGKANLPKVDVISFGSPCQDLSIAGKRKGMQGERSGLFYEAIRICFELEPTFAVWENVPGALSSNDGRDFAAVLSAFRECGARDICWAILDAQYFGVAQRRRRLFVVADFREERAAEILFEPESLPGHSKTRRQTGKAHPSTFTVRTGKDGGGKGYLGREDGALALSGQHQFLAYNIQSNDGGSHKRKDRPDGGLYVNETDKALTVGSTDMTVIVQTTVGTVSSKWHKGTGGPAGDEVQNLIVTEDAPVANTLSYKEPMRGDKGGNLIVVSDKHPTLDANYSSKFGNNQQMQSPDEIFLPIVWEMSHGDSPVRESGETAPTLQQRMGTGGNQVALVGVRKLMPIECERLQGFPDNWTDEQADSQRYKQLGNAVAVPVVAWIGRRIMEVVNGSKF